MSPSRRVHKEWDPCCKVYVGGLRFSPNHSEMEDAFAKYGPLRNVWIARNPPGFAFVEFEDSRDANDACRGLNGTRMWGNILVVEMSSGKRRDRRRDDRDRPYRRRSPPSRGRDSPYRRDRGSPIYGSKRDRSPYRGAGRGSPSYKPMTRRSRSSS